MRIPGPRDALALVDTTASLIPRTIALLDGAEALLGRVNALVDRIEETRAAADRVIVSTAGSVASAQPTIDRADAMVARLEPAMDRLQPVLERLAQTTSPDEVEALVRLVDQLPHLVDRLDSDILPIMDTFGSVAPDVHELLDTVKELNEMLAKVPGMGRLRRKADERDDIEGRD